MNVPQTSIARFRVLYYSFFTVSIVWYLYWILYEVFVWNKSFLQINISNYFGLGAMIGLILIGAEINIHHQPNRPSRSSFEERALQLEKVMALPLRIGDCPYDIDYFDQPNRAETIPNKCIACSNLVDCACRSSKREKAGTTLSAWIN